MYVFRALNDTDYENYKNGKGIWAKECPTASSIFAGGMIDQVIDHIRKGSNSNYTHCWISACKDFSLCATEYAIPQNGSYNTSSGRKHIAVIDLKNWLENEPRNLTVFLDKEQKSIKGLNISRDYLVPEAEKIGNCARSIKINNTPYTWDKKMLRQQVLQFKSAISENIENIEYGILDCSFPRKLKGGIPSLAELSLYEMGEKNKTKTVQYEILKGRPTAIVNGIAQTSSEILFFRQIPKNMIKCVLSPLEQDLLFLVNKDQRSLLLKNIQDNPIHYYNASYINIPLINQLKGNGNLEDEYKQLIDERKSTEIKILENLGYKVDFAAAIPEECGINVVDLDQKRGLAINNKASYDLLAVKYGGKLYIGKDAKIDNLKMLNIPKEVLDIE